MHYVVKIDGKTRIMDSQKIMPISSEFAVQLQTMIDSNVSEEEITAQIVDYIGK